MSPSKIVLLCLVGVVVLCSLIDARPAPKGGDGKTHHHHHHHTSKKGGGSGSPKKGGGSDDPKKGGGSGGPHTHHHKLPKTPGETHKHHFTVGGDGKPGGKPNIHSHHFSNAPKGGIPGGKPDKPDGKPDKPDGKPDKPDGKPGKPDGKPDLPDGKPHIHHHHFSNAPKGGPPGPKKPNGPGGPGGKPKKPEGPGGPGGKPPGGPGGKPPGGPGGKPKKPSGPGGPGGKPPGGPGGKPPGGPGGKPPGGPGGKPPGGPGGKPPGGPGGNININGNLPGGPSGNININGNLGGGGDLSLGGLNIKGFSPDTIAKFKQILSANNIDLSALGKLDLGLGGGGGGGALPGGPGTRHKFDGKDSLQPAMCEDSINDRYGVGKHFVRGTRDVGFAIVSEAQEILDPLVGFVTHGVGQGLKALLCAIEDGFSDFGSDFDSATDIAKHGLVNFFRLQGPNPVLGIPVGIAGIAGEAVKAAASIAGDAASGVGNALYELTNGLGLTK